MNPGATLFGRLALHFSTDVHRLHQSDAQSAVEAILEISSKSVDPIFWPLAEAAYCAAGCLPETCAIDLAERWLQILRKSKVYTTKDLGCAIAGAAGRVPQEIALKTVEVWLERFGTSDGLCVEALAWAIHAAAQRIPEGDAADAARVWLDSLSKLHGERAEVLAIAVDGVVGRVPITQASDILCTILSNLECWLEWESINVEAMLVRLARRVSAHHAFYAWTKFRKRLETTDLRRQPKLASILNRIINELASRLNLVDALSVIDQLKVDNEWHMALIVASHQVELAAVVAEVDPNHRAIKYTFFRRDDSSLLLTDDPAVTPAEIRRLLHGSAAASKGGAARPSATPSDESQETIAAIVSDTDKRRPLYVAVANLLRGESNGLTATEILTDPAVRKQCGFGESRLNQLLRERPDLFISPKKGRGAGWRLKSSHVG